MDTGKGTFERVEAKKNIDGSAIRNAMSALESKYPNHGGWFREGEILEINGSTFRVKRIKPTEIVLKLVKRK